MSIKDILVHLDGTASGAAAVDVALAAATAHGARLIGLAAILTYDMPGYVLAQIPAEAITTYRENAQETADTATRDFNNACEAAGVASEVRQGTWREPVENQICEHARYADMVIMGQPSEEESGFRVRDIADHVVLHAGAPVMLVPVKRPKESFGERILIGWDGGTHAARAVRDAIPFLVNANFVRVLAVDPKPGRAGLGDLPGADLAHYLSTHGVNVEADHRQSGNVSPGDILLNEATDMGADMLVMGSYGHSRLGELILGGVTDTLMQEMTVPVFMSH